jgi:hypothetical protein
MVDMGDDRKVTNMGDRFCAHDGRTLQGKALFFKPFSRADRGKP